MARKSLTFIATDGRDEGKHFIITEMQAIPTAKWIIRMGLAIARSGTNAIKDALNIDWDTLDWQSKFTVYEVATQGVSILGAMDFNEGEKVIDDLFKCVRLMPDPNHPNVIRDITCNEDIEEATTYAKLQMAAFKLHFDFFIHAAH
jgi:hypothetical protein